MASKKQNGWDPGSIPGWGVALLWHNHGRLFQKWAGEGESFDLIISSLLDLIG